MSLIQISWEDFKPVIWNLLIWCGGFSMADDIWSFLPYKSAKHLRKKQTKYHLSWILSLTLKPVRAPVPSKWTMAKLWLKLDNYNTWLRSWLKLQKGGNIISGLWPTLSPRNDINVQLIFNCKYTLKEK